MSLVSALVALLAVGANQVTHQERLKRLMSLLAIPVHWISRNMLRCGCSHTEALFEFQVTDGTKVLEGCEVLKCGFSLYYATDELRIKSTVSGPLEANQYISYSENGILDPRFPGLRLF